MIEKVDSFYSRSVSAATSDASLPDNYTEHPDYTHGTEDWQHLSMDFQSSVEKGLNAALEFISQSSNPNQITSMDGDESSLIKHNKIAPNLNCTYCSKAVDRNLDALAREDFNHYYVATESAEGSISENVENVHSQKLEKGQQLTRLLSDLVAQGKRAIITVPVKDRGYSHTVNFIHHSNGCAVIDGQLKQLYNFNSEADRENFDSRYGVGVDTEPATITVWNTGSFPILKGEQLDISTNDSKTESEHTPANIKHLARKQIHTKSCGACSLLVAAKELGVEEMPGIPNMKTTITGEKLSLSNTCEEDIYTITSGSTSYRTQQKELSNAGYSMPQGIVTASRLLGLDARVTQNGSIFTTILSYFYPQVEQECRGMNAEVQQETPADAAAYRMRAVAVSLVGVPAGLHWVIMRPDGSYMDPGTGMNAANFEELNANAKNTIRVLGYYDTGISVVLDNSELKKIKTNDPDINDARNIEASKIYQLR
ncbi:hypothetical protein GTG28_15150 [Vibrio sp. OCN044]|uniref:Uncharacterized protein n=1 Tax=Vibrio tetraodonis subsp. pristinus TaxID=2695891 RepID=A0A6L8LWR9_9VIBR|nr:hypothetical protein [Vibrio tetraodonis]MYM60568.1 hypothetical protein [Vibrio tetraodonis subsp. pristinus]